MMEQQNLTRALSTSPDRPIGWQVFFTDGTMADSREGDWSSISERCLLPGNITVWQTQKPVRRLLLFHGSHQIYQLLPPDEQTPIFSYTRFAAPIGGGSQLWLQSVFGFITENTRVLTRILAFGLITEVSHAATPFPL